MMKVYVLPNSNFYPVHHRSYAETMILNGFICVRLTVRLFEVIAFLLVCRLSMVLSHRIVLNGFLPLPELFLLLRLGGASYLSTMQIALALMRLSRLLSFIVTTRDDDLCLEVDDSKMLTWYADEAFSVHADTRSHTGSVFR